jgi:hypothetical protein
MLTAEECALVNDIGEKLLDLYSKRDDAISDGDADLAHELQCEIDDAKAERQKIMDVAAR